MSFLPSEGYKKVLCVIAYSLAGAAALYVFVKYALPFFLPFLFAWLVAALLQKPVVFAEKKLKVPKKIAAAIIVVLFLSAASLIIFALASVLIRRSGEFISNLSAEAQKITSDVNEAFAKIGKFLEKFGIEYGGGLPDVISDALSSAVSMIAAKITGLAAALATSLPKALIFFAALIISCVYFCADYRKIADFLLAALPKKAAVTVSTLKKEFSAVTTKYFKSYSIIFFMTFGELFLGLTIIGIENAPLIALFIAAVDILPVLGAGIVLVPWAILRLVSGDIKTGIFLLILYAVISLVRQLTEPRIVGRGIGLHPALSLIAMYVGLCAFGVMGMICMPLVVAVIKNTVTALKNQKKCGG